MSLFEEFDKRSIVDLVSHDELKQKLTTDKLKFYTGFDPTAKSLQLGNLFPVVCMRRLQMAGHKPFVLVGGATGMIGDPSGKNQERNLLDAQTLQDNVNGQKSQLEKLLDFNDTSSGALMVNNFDWFQGLGFLEVLRDIGKRFSLTDMLAKDSVKSRLSSESGISFTEFSYQLLQAYDFAYLNKTHGVNLQVGGNDQWGNITAGIDLTRKMYSERVYGMTVPLVTDSQGKKFGKSEGGNTIYLDESMTSAYEMYQYLFNVDDETVIKLLKYYTFLSMDEVFELERLTREEGQNRQAQKTLAQEVVKLVHGNQGLESAESATKFFFGAKIENVNDDQIANIFKDVPSVTLERTDLDNGIDIISLVSQTPLFKSKGEARRSLDQKGVYLNNTSIENKDLVLNSEHLASESSLIIRKGKKKYCLVRFQ
jgi:tyrosyl-tRNA synthetase